MPYKKNGRRYRKKQYKYKAGFRMKNKYIGKIGADVQYLKTLINSEPKNHIVQFNNNVNWNGVVLDCCSIAQGDSSSNRDGERILPRFFNIYGRLAAPDRDWETVLCDS